VELSAKPRSHTVKMNALYLIKKKKSGNRLQALLLIKFKNIIE